LTPLVSRLIQSAKGVAVIYTPTRLALALAAVLFAAPLFAQNDDAALNVAEPDVDEVGVPHHTPLRAAAQV
jgi:hypothetical protein